MANQLLNLARHNLLKRVIANQVLQPSAAFHGREKIGKREVVGFGINGEYSYIDRADFPCPAIRFQEDTAEVTKLREKEKGDWKKLTVDEKKTLYRTSFRLTYAEQEAPTGDYKFIIGGVFTCVSLMLWVFMGMKKFVYPPLPYSMTPEHQQAMLMKMLDLRVDPIEGLSSKYDYENKKWK